MMGRDMELLKVPVPVLLLGQVEGKAGWGVSKVHTLTLRVWAQAAARWRLVDTFLATGIG